MDRSEVPIVRNDFRLTEHVINLNYNGKAFVIYYLVKLFVYKVLNDYLYRSNSANAHFTKVHVVYLSTNHVYSMRIQMRVIEIEVVKIFSKKPYLTVYLSLFLFHVYGCV